MKLSEVPGIPDIATSDKIMRYEKFYSERASKSLEALKGLQEKRLIQRTKGRILSQE